MKDCFCFALLLLSVLCTWLLKLDFLDVAGYSAGNETQPGPTIMQKVKEKVSDYENHLKGKESTNKEDPHPKLAYIPPRDGKGEGVADLQEEKQHRGASTAALGNDVPAKVTRDYISSVKHEKSGGIITFFVWCIQCCPSGDK
jgi:hypothetical protein